MADFESARRSAALASATPPDIDRILQAIRDEARARGSRGTIGGYQPAMGGPVDANAQPMAVLEVGHVADFLALPLDAFIASAYREVLGRNPDSTGSMNYQRALLRGRLTRIEVLGRMALSPEGRAQARRIPGLHAAFVAATAYRVPLLGPVAAVAARILRLPAHLQDRSGLEAAALASGAWMKR